MEPPTDVQKLIEQVQQLLLESVAQKERFGALEAENVALRAPRGRIGAPIGIEQQ
jgi:hypothetical protein